MVLPPQPIANFNRNRRREFWNVAARLVRKLEGEEVGVEIDDGCRSERGSSRMYTQYEDSGTVTVGRYQNSGAKYGTLDIKF